MNESNKKKFIELGEILEKVFPYNIINNDGHECVEEVINECIKAPEIIDFEKKDFNEAIILSQLWALLCASPDDEEIVECYKEYLESKNYKVSSMALLQEEFERVGVFNVLASGIFRNFSIHDNYFYKNKNKEYISIGSFEAYKDFENSGSEFKNFYLKKIFKEDFTQAGYSLDDFIKDIKECIKKEILNF